MKHPATQMLLTTGKLCNYWITAKDVCFHIGLNQSNPNQKELIELMVVQGIIPYFDFVYKHQRYGCVFQWDSQCSKNGHEEYHRKLYGHTLLISLRCYKKLNKQYEHDLTNNITNNLNSKI